MGIEVEKSDEKKEKIKEIRVDLLYEKSLASNSKCISFLFFLLIS
jgi:hypothetical protein